jgi:hypothetical protein
MLQAPYFVLEVAIKMHDLLQDSATSTEVMVTPDLRCLSAISSVSDVTIKRQRCFRDRLMATESQQFNTFQWTAYHLGKQFCP